MKTESAMKHLLLEAAHEIHRLRRENELLRAKQEMIDLFACVLHTKPANHIGNGVGPDIAYQLEKVAGELEVAP